MVKSCFSGNYTVLKITHSIFVETMHISNMSEWEIRQFINTLPSISEGAANPGAFEFLVKSKKVNFYITKFVKFRL